MCVPGDLMKRACSLQLSRQCRSSVNFQLLVVQDVYTGGRRVKDTQEPAVFFPTFVQIEDKGELRLPKRAEDNP